MTACKSGIKLNLLPWVCVLLISSGSVESLEWTAEPENPTKVTEGQKVTLTWSYSLTAAEQADSNVYNVKWFKFNSSSLEYTEIASYAIFGGTFIKEPNQPHIMVGRPIASDSATLVINDVKRNDEGLYKIEYSLASGKLNESEISLTVLVPPGIANVSNDQVECEGSMVTLVCNATGRPTPNVTWTKVDDNGMDSAPLLPVVQGKYILSNILRYTDATYRCTADNGVGTPDNRTVSVKVKYVPAVESIDNSSNSVIEGQSFNMACVTSGYPKPNVYWIKESNDARINGSVLNFININRNDSGKYRCEAKNDCGSNSSVQLIEVFYKPDNVELLTNTTEDSYCSDLWVNFTCKASDANPAVSNYVLYEHNNPVASNNNGTWILKLSEAKNHVYHCVAEHFVETVTSTSNVTITVNVSASVISVNTTSFSEGEDVILFCVVSGVPSPVVSWFHDKNETVYNGSLWKLPSVNRSYSGKYKCEASNGCGKDSKAFDVIVQYEPGDVRLRSNITNSTICAEYIVNFTCSADANPAVDSYTLFKNGSVVDTSSLGVWLIRMNTAGQFVYRCEAHNSVGSGKSSDVTFNVKVPAKVINVNTTIFTEGEDAILFCDVSGVPAPVVSCFNDKNGNVYHGSLWKLLSINRSYNGTYQCIASNACGMDSKTFDIIVQYKPEGVRLSPNITNSSVCAGYSVNFTCSANANPAVDSYTLFENGSAVHASSLGVWSMTMNTAGRFVYTCEANNSVGFSKSSDVIVNVEDPPTKGSYSAIVRVPEGTQVNLSCPVDGRPEPNITWYKGNDTTAEAQHQGREWTFQAASNDAGWYSCSAKNFLNLCKPVKVSFQLIVEKGTTTASTTNPSQVNYSLQVTLPDTEYLLDYDNLSSAPAQELASTFLAEVDKLYENVANYVETEVTKLSRGSVIVSFAMYFTTQVGDNEGLAKLRDAVDNNKKLGNFTVEALKIIHPVNPSTAASIEGSTGNPSNSSQKDGPPWIIIGAAAGGGAVSVFAIIVLLICCLRRDKKEGGSDALARENEIEHSAVEEDAHEEKTVKKPEETLYAELRDLDQGQRPNKPSYPEALPPVKRPSPYERTDYAEITHFIKRDVNDQQQMWSQNGKKEPGIGMQTFC